MDGLWNGSVLFLERRPICSSLQMPPSVTEMTIPGNQPKSEIESQFLDSCPNTEWTGRIIEPSARIHCICTELDVPHSSLYGALEIAKLENQPIMEHEELPRSNGAPRQSPRPRTSKKMDTILVTKLQKEGLTSSFMAPGENACVDHWHLGRLLYFLNPLYGSRSTGLGRTTPT